MAIYRFTEAIATGQPIHLYNDGNMQRDFTYVDDIVEAVARLTYRPSQPDAAWDGQQPSPGSSWAPYRIHNIGNHRAVPLLHVVELIEKALGKKATRVLMPMQPGDVTTTWADVESLSQTVGFRPDTPVEVGIPRFVEWYQDFHQSAKSV
jgi:UDP-glucuronate 4-epimerase